MKTGKVLNFKALGGIFDFVKRNKLLLLLIMLFVAGLFLGITALGKYEVLFRAADAAVNGFIKFRTENGFLKIAFDSFLKSMLFVVLVFLLGASVTGVAAVPLAVMLLSFIYGVASAFLYSEYSFKGIAVNAVMFMPPAVIFSVSLIILSIEAVGFSRNLLSVVLPKNSFSDMSVVFASYSAKTAFCTAAVAASALADAFISVNFAEKLSL